MELFGNPNVEAAAYMSRGSRVTFNSEGKAVLAGADERGYGTVAIEEVEPGQTFAMRPLNSPGVHYMIASGTIPVGSKIAPAADGKVAAAVEGAAVVIGVRTSSDATPVSQDGDVLGVLPVFN